MRARPTMAAVMDWLEGRLDTDRAAALVATAQDDPRSASDVAWARRLLHDARLLPLVQPPPELSAALRAIFERTTERRGSRRNVSA
ncbi:MAG TPA: hypothetical protein VNS46_21340 [Nocardioides sp.]|nr:hypothetical protein [Nocardioides sp.]